jgi:hypothetical protein
MEPNKKIPSFCFESPWLKPFDLDLNSVEITAGERRIRTIWTPELAQDLEAYHNIDAETELTRLLNEELHQQTENNIRANIIAQDLISIQPVGGPPGTLFYYNFSFGEIENPTIYGDGCWSVGNTFNSSIGIDIDLKSHKFI